MSGTATSNFRVEAIDDDHVWLEKRVDPRKGFQVAVPRENVRYDEDLRRKISDLEEGSTIEAELESEKQRNTAWHFKDFRVTDDVPGDRTDRSHRRLPPSSR